MSSPAPLKVGMVGGGGGAFIAGPHQKAIHLDGTRKVTQVALHPDPNTALREADNWPYPVTGYESYDAMLAAQSKLPKADRIDYLLVATPNFVHLDPVMKALDAGVPVMCEKPLAMSLHEADQIMTRVEEKQIPFAVAHPYICHWSSYFSRWIVQSGLLGEIRWVDSYYIQEWLANPIEETGQMQAAWRTDPERAGASGCGADIGTHALMQLRFVTGIDVSKVSAHLECMVPGRTIDDHFTAYGRLSNGGKCLVRGSQICPGHANDLGINVVGSMGALKWRLEDSEVVTICTPGRPDRKYLRGAVTANDGFLSDVPNGLLHEPTLPAGHCEGFHDAMARLHREFENDVRKYNTGQVWHCDGSMYANVWDGRMGVAFIDACVTSSKGEGAWTAIP